MSRSDLVSVIIPTYNRAHLIGETIESVRAQTIDNWEIIIVDDCSTDNTESLVHGFQDQRIRYIRIDHRGLIGKVRNIGMEIANGSFIAFLDSDDLWEPNKLECQLNLFNEYPHIAFAFSHGKQFGAGAIPPPELEKFYLGNIFHAHLLEERFVMYPSTFIFRKDVLNGMEWFDENFSAGESDFFLRMALTNDGVFVNEQLVRLRRHSKNVSRERDVIFSQDNIKMIDKFLRRKYISKEEYIALASKQYYKQGVIFLKRSKPFDSLDAFRKYFGLKPFHYKGWMRLTQAWILSLRSKQIPV